MSKVQKKKHCQSNLCFQEMKSSYRSMLTVESALAIRYIEQIFNCSKLMHVFALD